MDRKLVIVGIEGFAASSRKEEKTLSNILISYVQKYEENVLDFKEIHSSRFSSVADARDFIDARYSPNNNLLLVGKSLGGVKLYRLLKRDWKIINKYNRVVCLFIDAHSPFPTFIGNFRNLRIRKKWLKPNRVFFNVYQKEKYPKGAKVKRATHEVHLTDADHWNIVRHAETKELLRNAFNYLTA